jgi:hypothetical protein
MLLLPAACTEKERMEEIRKISGGEKRVHATVCYLLAAAQRKNEWRRTLGWIYFG